MRRSGEQRAVWHFVASVVAAGLVVVAGGSWVASEWAEDAAVARSRDLTTALGDAVIEPVLSDALASRDLEATLVLADAARRVKSDDLVRVKIWDASGKVWWSDDPAVIGKTFPLDDEELEALQEETAAAEVGGLDDAESADEKKFGQLIEVYKGMRTAEGTPVLFEAYLRYSQVEEERSQVQQRLLIVLLGGLGVLLAAQVPLALRLVRRLEAGRLQQDLLRRRAAQVEEVERVKIAADLHDGVVQQLSGSAMTLAAAARKADQAGATEAAQQVRSAAGEIRRGIRDLRGTITVLSSNLLEERGLPAALEELVGLAKSRGLDASLSVEAEVTGDLAHLVFRVAQEATRNTLRYAQAKTLTLTLEDTSGKVTLTVSDDGRGFDAQTQKDARTDGHVGLALCEDLARSAGGSLKTTSLPGQGTTVTLEVTP